MAPKPPKKQSTMRSFWVKAFGSGFFGLCYALLISILRSNIASNGNHEDGASAFLTPSVPLKHQWAKSQISGMGKEKNSSIIYFQPSFSPTTPHGRHEAKLESFNSSEAPQSSQPGTPVVSQDDNPSTSHPIILGHTRSNSTFALHSFEGQHTKTYMKTTENDLSIKKLRLQGVNITESELIDIPSWEQVTDIFGTEPVILGLENCEAYRQAVPAQNRSILPAGNFNTGTNLFPEFFHRNCAGRFPQNLMQVNWGKHNLANARLENYVVNKTKYQAILSEHVLAVVMVRHPVSWMFSTCVHSYGARWRHNERNCPHLLHENRTDGKLNYVRVSYGWNRYGRKQTPYKSLIHFWRDWIHSYIKPDLPFPRLIIRLEDVVFRPEAVLKKVCECAGGQQRSRKVSVPVESVKVQKDRLRKKQNRTGFLTQGKETAGLLKAWSKHASIASLWQQITPGDQRIIKEVLLQEDQHNLLRQLRYNLEGTVQQ